jgi:hypothetical protein
VHQKEGNHTTANQTENNNKYLQGIINKNLQMKPLEEITAVDISKVLNMMPDKEKAQFLHMFLCSMSGSLAVEITYKFGS